MKKYSIVSATEKDFNQCVITVRKAFYESREKFGFTKENYPSSGAFITEADLVAARLRGVHMYVAVIKKQIIGYVQLEKKNNGVYSFQKFAVLPEYRHLGVGADLIAFCKDRATQYGGKKISLIMVDKNTQLKEYYLLNGFKFVGTKSDETHPFVQGVMEMDL